MRETTGTFEAHDGLTLFERSWHPGDPPRAVVAILHGGGEHPGRYTHVAERLTAEGFRVDAFDQRSHGRSERVRGVALQCDDAQHLLDHTARWLRRRPVDVPLFVIGHTHRLTGALSRPSRLCPDRGRRCGQDPDRNDGPGRPAERHRPGVRSSGRAHAMIGAVRPTSEVADA